MEFYSPNELNEDLFDKQVHRSSLDISRQNSVEIKQRVKSPKQNSQAQIKNKKLVTILTNKMFRGYLKVKALREEKEKVFSTIYANNKKFYVTTRTSDEKRNLKLNSSQNEMKFTNPLKIQVVKDFGLCNPQKLNRDNVQRDNFFVTHKHNTKQNEDEQRVKMLLKNIYSNKDEILQYNKVTFIAFNTKQTRKPIDERNKVRIEKEMLNDIANINKRVTTKFKEERQRLRINLNTTNGNQISFKDMYVLNNDSNNFEFSIVTDERINRIDTTRRISKEKSPPIEEKVDTQLSRNSHSTNNIKNLQLYDEKAKFSKIKSNLFRTKSKKQIANSSKKRDVIHNDRKKNCPSISDLVIAPNEDYESHHVATTISESFFSGNRKNNAPSYHHKPMSSNNKSKGEKKEKFQKLKEIVFGATGSSFNKPSTPNTMRRTATTHFETGTTNTLYSNFPQMNKRSTKLNENRQRDTKISKVLYTMFEKGDVDKIIYGRTDLN